MLFSLTLCELIDDIGQIPGVEVQLWYLDDGSFIGSRAAIASLLSSLLHKGPKHGLYVNLSKCEVYWPSGNQEFPEIDSDVRRVNSNSSGLELLGSPIVGSDDFFQDFFKTKIDKILLTQSRLCDLDDPQVELQLLRSCLGMCKLNHLLRTTPFGEADCQLQRFDTGLRHSLQLITRSSISDSSWIQATLPARLGGLGLREASCSAAAAFLGSCNSSRELIAQLLSTTYFAQAIAIPGEDAARSYLSDLLHTFCIDLNDPGLSQHGLQSHLDSSTLTFLKSVSSIRDQARLSSLATPHTGAWHRAIPNPKLGLSMSREEFVTGIRVYLGLQLFPSPPNVVRCSCGHILDVYGDHLLGCGNKGLRIKRHNTLRDVIFHYLLSDNKASKIEQTCNSNNNKRPGDLYHPDFLEGRPAYFDVSVRNSLQPSYIVHAATNPGVAAEAGEEEKDAKHDADVTNTGCSFYPLVVETLGLWSQSSLKILKVIATRSAVLQNISLSQAVNNLHEQISVRLWQFHARMILDRFVLEDMDFLGDSV